MRYYFYSNWKALKQAELKRGAYHYYLPDIDPALLKHKIFMMNVSIHNGDLPPVLDMEITDVDDPETFVKDIKT